MGQGAEVLGLTLKEVRVRPVRDAWERAEWDRLMDEHHYLGFRGMVGGGLRHVAEGPDGRWLALVGWAPGAFKVGVRDAWLGWAAEQRFRRLRLVANNTRFLVLPGCRIRNLASRALSLSTRRLSADMEALHGHPVLLAETFVDPKRFRGTCYLAANWTPLGMSRGYARARRLGGARPAEAVAGAGVGARCPGGPVGAGGSGCAGRGGWRAAAARAVAQPARLSPRGA